MNTALTILLIVVIAAVVLWCLFVLFYMGVLIYLARLNNGRATVSVKPFAPKGLKYEVRKGLVTA